jgi:hypothetical protein
VKESVHGQKAQVKKPIVFSGHLLRINGFFVIFLYIRTEQTQTKRSITGSQGRTTVIIFFTMLFLIFITVITYYGLTQGRW